jgi:hypothetical protein
MIKFMNTQLAFQKVLLVANLRRICVACAVIVCLQGETAANVTERGDGTLFGTETSLAWQQQDDAKSRTWETAKRYCDTLSLGGHYDWRLPDLKELKSIADTTQLGPAIKPLFTNLQSAGYWSSTACTFDITRRRYVNFLDGRVGTSSKTDELCTRCVRPCRGSSVH